MPTSLSCTPGPKRGDRVVCADCGRPVAFIRFAFNYRKLRREPYFQTTQGRAVLEMLQRRYPRDPRVLNWLLREYRRGRLIVSPQWMQHVQMLQEGEQAQDPHYIERANRLLDDPNRPDIVLWDQTHLTHDGTPHPVQPGIVPAIGQMMDRGVSGQGVDLMKYTYPEFMPLYNKWNEEKRQRDPNAGEVVHAYPDGWTMRRISSPDEAYTEGEEMQNCLPKFATDINSGRYHIFSLRDHQNAPHANVLIAPRNLGGHWEGGVVRDIRGKQNAKPALVNPDYHQKVVDWFNTFNEKPSVLWDRAPIGKGAGEPEEYGLNYHPARQVYGTYPEDFLDLDEYDQQYGQQPPREASWIFESARIDELRDPRRRADLATPEGQEFLDTLGMYHSHQNDILMPFLANQWKRGHVRVQANRYGEKHLTYQPGGEIGPEHLQEGTGAKRDYDYWLGEYGPEQAWKYTLQNHPEVVNGESLRTEELNDMGDWLKSKHPTTKGLDLLNKNLTFDQLRAKNAEYQDWLRKKRDKSAIVHKGPNGSYIKRLFGDDLRWEGAPEQMNNCIGGYTHSSVDGSRLLYSIRDKEGKPHVDIEIHPKWWYNSKTRERLPAHEVPIEDRHKTEKGGDWQPVPQEGQIIQIQGKNNAPPHEKYHHLVKDWFTSPHFLNPEKGEDYRPEWQLANTHFGTMTQLYNPGTNHVIYYHPGDYGVENPPVTTDYNGMVQSLMVESRHDPENKRLKHLVQWAKQFNELPQLKEALQNPGNLQHLQRGMTVDPGDDPEYAEWTAQNPEPPRPTGVCPYCGGNDIAEDRYGDGYDLCNHCMREWHIGANRAEVDPEAAAAHQAWTQQQQQLDTAARQRLLAGTWEQSPAGQAVNDLSNMVDYHLGGQPERIAKRVFFEDGWGCHCNACGGWDFGIDDFRLAAIIKEANGFNKVRNMLKKQQGEISLKNNVALEAMRHQFPSHDTFAEYLHREFRKGRLGMESKDAGGNKDLATALANEQTAKQQMDQYKTYIEYANNPDYGEEDRRYYEREAERYKETAQDYQESADQAWTKVGNVDPEELAKSIQFTVPGGKVDTWGNGKNPLTNEHLDIMKEIMKKRVQRWQNATPEQQEEFSKADPETKAKWRELNAEYGEWEKQPPQERGDWPEEKAFNKLEQHNLMKTELPELYDAAKEEALSRLGLKLGKVIHTFPDNWTMRYIDTPEAANIESEMLGHCIRSYGDQIAAGNSVNFSVRDPKGNAHATFEITPKRGMSVDWNRIDPQMEKMNEPAMCPECGGMINEDGICSSCGHNIDVDPIFAQYTPEQIQTFKDYNKREQEGETLDSYYDKGVKSYNQFKREMKDRDLARPNWQGGTLRQIQGKSGATPPWKYLKYVRQWADTLPYEERPVASGSYSNPVYHHDQLDDYINKVDALGFQAPSRTIEWNSVLNSLHPGAKLNMEGTRQQPMAAPTTEQYDPALGQKLYDFAAANDGLFDVYKAMNAWDKPLPVSERDRESVVAECPRCHNNYKQYPDRYEVGSVYCGYCGEEYPQEEANFQKPGQATPPRTGPQYTPYQAAAVQHIGSLLAQHPELQTLGMHGADQLVKMQCSHCGGPINPCQECGVDANGGNDHGICANCGNVAYYPHQNVQARVAATHPRHPIPTPHTGYDGNECRCMWHPINQGLRRMAHVKVADKFNDYLMKRQDLQTPEAQDFLGHVQQHYLTDQTDPLTPWLTREWKKGRIWPAGNLNNPGPALYANIDHDEGGESMALTPAYLNHIGDWYHSAHPTRQGVDIMQLGSPELLDRVNQWDEAMREQAGGAAEKQGQIVKHWPDGWTMQKLMDENHLKEEGDKMGHCVGGYGARVKGGHSLIYSLRDPNNEPHVTTEISPTHYKCGGCGSINKRGRSLHANGMRECGCEPSEDSLHHDNPGTSDETVPHFGELVQIQGKANEAPKPEYQGRLKDWFTNDFNDHGVDARPQWQDQDVDDYDGLAGDDGGYHEYHEGDYGLEPPKMDYDWNNILESMHSSNTDWGPDHTDYATVVDAAAKQGELPELESELGDWYNEAERNFDWDFNRSWENDPEQQAEEAGYEKFEDSPYFDEVSPEDECGYCDGTGKVESELDPEDEDYEEEEECPECGGDGKVENPSFEQEYEQAKDEYYERLRDEVRDDAWGNDPRNDWYYAFDGAIRNAKRHHMGRTAKRLLHKNFSTGQPCHCRFTSHHKPLPALTASHTQCPTCGDEMEAGYCKRCDWGPHNVAEPQKENPTDPTRDTKGPYQSRVAFPDRWSWAELR